MKKAVLLFLVIFSLALQAKSTFKEFTTEIMDTDGKTAVIKDSKDIYIGSSGIVLHNFSDGTSTIIARADVIKKDGKEAKIKFYVYDILEQKALPIPKIMPKKGDKVILNYLYDRSLIVAPNYKIYKEITKHFKDITWVHPDLMGAYLSTIYRPNPDKKIFHEMCKQNSTGVIFFALSYNGYFIDCNNFKVIKKYESARIKKAQLPFYTRVSGIETSWLDFDSSTMHTYSKYYRDMLGL